MKVTAIKTHKIIPRRETIYQVLNKYIKSLKENSIVAITSKIISICEGRVVKIDDANKLNLIKQEAKYFIPPEKSKYNITFTIKNDNLIATAGIDESNGNGFYVLWPKDPQKSANDIREYLIKKFNLKNIGVIITDSRTYPLKWGITGFAITHSGFMALKDYIGKPDIFGRILMVTQSNIKDSLATTAVLAMGEGDEQTPVAIIEEVPFVDFVNRNPTKKEINDLKIKFEDDLYYPILKNVKWEKGKGK